MVNSKERLALNIMCSQCNKYSRCMALAKSDWDRDVKKCEPYTILENAVEDLALTNEYIYEMAQLVEQIELAESVMESNEKEQVELAAERVENASL